ncbi:cytochrome P450 alkane hydroxylase [Colletotrichum navitas]|uniref:Cytochrome P450 alkane hydroxylase n=1 Tax=Colletotrichum navitas TaxID=681940 RepID=A0AAD8PNI8_9PEZI|nr:cytochrome P450 alkane hydroxylase [Colletotrichum navitas]KAK1573006.1 cytochrome P450 alkane hydroxylase [Colletotrichum navitas]
MALAAISLLVKGLGIVIVIYVLRCLQLRLHRRQLASKNNCRPCPAYPQRDPIFGIDTHIETIQGFRNNHYLDLLIKRHNKFGRTFSFDLFGSTTISTCDPDVLKCALSSHFKDFSNGDLRAKSVAPLLGRGILAADGEEWHHQRALIRPSFARAQATDLSIFERHATQLIRAIERKGCNVDIQELVQQMILDANTEYLFGESTGLLTEHASTSALLLNEALDYALEGVIYRIRLGKLMPLHRDPKFWDACKTVHAFADQYVAQALELRNLHAKNKEASDEEARLPKRYVLLNEMAKDTSDPILLRDEIVTIVMAARDTTSATVSFALYLLARRPDIWAKLRTNVMQHYISPLTYEALEDMKYLKWVVAETLRLFPPIANNGRMAVRDTVFPVGGGPDGKAPLLVTKGTTVLFSVYVMQRRTDLWGPDAENFEPERWSPESERKGRHGWEYLPFLGGPRICPGQKFALTQASHVLARLAHAFERIENMDPRDWREQWTLSVAPKDGVKVKLVPAA